MSNPYELIFDSAEPNIPERHSGRTTAEVEINLEDLQAVAVAADLPSDVLPTGGTSLIQ